MTPSHHPDLTEASSAIRVACSSQAFHGIERGCISCFVYPKNEPDVTGCLSIFRPVNIARVIIGWSSTGSKVEPNLQPAFAARHPIFLSSVGPNWMSRVSDGNFSRAMRRNKKK
jgi:hypothetical protein